jgi:hypothetical protein
VLEYDRTLRAQGGYRDFMFKQSRYQEVVPLEHISGSPAEVAELRSGCTVLYRLRYVRDILLHPKIDDPGITAIGSMISFSSSEICTQVSGPYTIVLTLWCMYDGSVLNDRSWRACLQILQNPGYVVRVLNVVWPALNVDNYVTAEAPPAPTSQTVSPTTPNKAGGISRARSRSSSGEEGEVLVGPMPATTVVPAVVAAVAARGGSSPMVTPPLGSPALPASPTNSSAPGSPRQETRDSDGADPADAVVEGAGRGVANRPIDGLRFLRELFAMSKFLQVEKRWVRACGLALVSVLICVLYANIPAGWSCFTICLRSCSSRYSWC